MCNPPQVLGPFVAFTSANVALLLIWTLVNPMVFVRHQTSLTSSFGICEPKYMGGARLIPIVLFGVLNCCTLVVANIQAYRARRISDEYSESKFVFISLVSILQAVILGAPVAFITVKQPRIFTCVVSSFCFIITTTLLLLIFVPKILLSRKKIKEKRAGEGTGVRLQESNTAEGILAMKRSPTRNFSLEVSRVVCSSSCALQRWISPFPLLLEQDRDNTKKKLEDLAALLREQGIDVVTLFSDVGLDVPEPDSTSSPTSDGKS